MAREEAYFREKAARDREEFKEHCRDKEEDTDRQRYKSREFWQKQGQSRKHIVEFKRQEWEETWSRFCEVSSSTELRFNDIPWLPDTCSVSGVVDIDTESTRKKKYHTALLRWHPDKFLATFGNYLV